MYIDSIHQKMMVVGMREALRLNPGKLSGWNILSIRGRMNEGPLSFPGARRIKTLHFDDVIEDDPEEHGFAATAGDIRTALEFSHEIKDEPLLIHCAAGISRSTAVAWIILYDKLKGQPVDAVRQSFDIVCSLRPILSPNLHVLRLGIEALVPSGRRKAVMDQFGDRLLGFSAAISPVVLEDMDMRLRKAWGAD